MDLSFLGDKERQNRALDWLDGIDMWLHMPVGHDESTLRCRTIRDFVAQYRSYFDVWYRLTPDAEDKQFEPALDAMVTTLPKFFNGRLSIYELDRPLLSVFRGRHRFPTRFNVKRCIGELSREFEGAIPPSRNRLKRFDSHWTPLPYVLGLLPMLIWMTGDEIWWNVPTLGWIGIGTYLLMPGIILLVAAHLPDPPWHEHSEPGLTLREAMLRYADKVRTEQAPENPEKLEERLIKFFWEDGQPKPSLDDLLPLHR